MITFKKHLKTLLVCGAIIMLAACSSARKNTDEAAVNDANAAYQDDETRASGLGDGSGFDEQGRGGQLLSKRVYYFDFDSNVVRDEDKPAILANADYLMAHTNKHIIVEGHTDPRGSREYNIGLGERRAEAVVHILTARGVDRSQIRVVSYGSQKASAGHSEADYQQDRRVVVVYIK